MTGPLSGLTVLDLTQYITGPYATKLLADYGADVIKIERPGGDPARRLGPFPADKPHPEKSGTFFFFNTNKRSVVVDLRRATGREVLGRLVGRADLVVESFRPGALDALGVGWRFIHERNPSAPLVSISNFGQEGPYRDYKISDAILWGFGGEMYATGLAGREPVKMYGTAALVQAGAAAATAALAAAMVGVDQAIGQHVDFAIVDAQLCSADRRHGTIIGFEFSGRKTVRRESEAIGLADGVYPCADGYVELHGAGRRFDRLIDMLGEPEWILDARWRTPAAALDPATIEEFNTHLQSWLMTRTKREIWDDARRARVLAAPLFTTREILEDPHFRARGLWTTVPHEVLGDVEIPGRPFIMNDSPWELRLPAPLLGQHTREVLGECDYSATEIETLSAEKVIGVR
jgi:crotonobetainyl-CoA:carnitine CoA-transferase CaiB-like acyl-CoA transferase